MHISKGGYPVTLLPPPRRLVPSLGLGTTWVRQPRSGSCHYPTAATKCNVQPSHRNPVGGKACSSTKGGLLRYIPNTYLIHKVSSWKFAYFQGRLSRHTTIYEFCLNVIFLLKQKGLFFLIEQQLNILNKKERHWQLVVFRTITDNFTYTQLTVCIHAGRYFLTCNNNLVIFSTSAPGISEL